MFFSYEMVFELKKRISLVTIFGAMALWKRKRPGGPLGKFTCMWEDGVYVGVKARATDIIFGDRQRVAPGDGQEEARVRKMGTKQLGQGRRRSMSKERGRSRDGRRDTQRRSHDDGQRLQGGVRGARSCGEDSETSREKCWTKSDSLRDVPDACRCSGRQRATGTHCGLPNENGSIEGHSKGRHGPQTNEGVHGQGSRVTCEANEVETRRETSTGRKAQRQGRQEKECQCGDLTQEAAVVRWDQENPKTPWSGTGRTNEGTQTKSTGSGWEPKGKIGKRKRRTRRGS